jgi:hypothetical protein
MKNLILLVFLCFSNSFVKSQLLCEWGDYNEFAQSYFMDVAVDNAGFTYVSGYFGGQIQVGTNTVYAESYPDGYIMKYSQNGDRLWVTSFSSSDNVFTFEMDVDNAGNTTIYGKFRSNLSVDGVTITASSSSSENGFVAQLNPDGDLNWIKNITSSSANYWARYLEVDDSGNVLFENYNTSTIDGFTNYGHYTLTKLDPLGNVLWRYDKELFGGSNYKSNLIAEFNNGYVIAGHINDTTVIAGTTIYPTNDTIIDPYNDTTLLLKPETVLIFLDNDGNETDVRIIEGSEVISIYALYATDSILYVSGRGNGLLTNGSQQVNTPSWMNFLTAYDTTLNPLFLETSVPFENRGLYANESHIYTVGAKGGGYMEKFDTQGILQDTLAISSYIQDIRGYNDGKVVIVGISSASLNTCGFTMNPENGFGGYVLKLDEKIVNQEEFDNHVQNILVYPNPTHTNLTVKTPFETGSIELLTLEGRSLFELDSENMISTQIDCSEYNSGVYILKITDNKSNFYCRRIIVK